MTGGVKKGAHGGEKAKKSGVTKRSESINNSSLQTKQKS